MATPTDRREDFVHKGRVVYSLFYTFVGGGGIVTRLDSDGNTITGARPAEYGRRIVTKKPGECVYVGGEWYQVAKVEVFASLPVEPVVPSGEGRTSIRTRVSRSGRPWSAKSAGAGSGFHAAVSAISTGKDGQGCPGRISEAIRRTSDMDQL